MLSRRSEIGLPEIGHKIIGEPAAAKVNPASVVDGQFSMPFCAAVALRDWRDLAWDDYARHIDDDDTAALMQAGHDGGRFPGPGGVVPYNMAVRNHGRQ